MKRISILWILLIPCITFCWTSCDNETKDPLSLHEVENHTIRIYYGSQGGVTITGGDGNYSFSCESPLLKAEMTYRNYILFEPVGVGNATVTIYDSSGESYVLNVVVAYKTEHIVISQLDATVVGEAMTAGEQEELKEKALATIPVKAGGGYKFVYTQGDELEGQEGVAVVYPEKYGQDGIEVTFRHMVIKKDDGCAYLTYVLHYNDTVRTFIFMNYDKPVVRTSPPVDIQLAEDLKEQYLADYPNVEQVYTSQIIGRITVE